MRRLAIGAAFLGILIFVGWLSQSSGPARAAPRPVAPLGPPSWAVLTPDGSHLVTDHLLNGRLWHVKSGEELRAFDVPGSGNNACIWTVLASRPPVFSRDGTRMVLTDGATPKVLDVFTGEDRGKVPAGFLAFGPQDDSVAVAKGGEVQIVELSSEAVLATIRNPIGDQEWRLAWSPDGRWMAFLGREAIEVVDVSTGKSAMSVAGLPNCSPEGVFKPNSDELWTWSKDQIEVWQVSTGKKVRSRTLPDTLIYSLVITREGRVVLAGTSSSAPPSSLPVKVWVFEP